MANTVRVNADHRCDLHPLADHMTKLRNFTKGEIREFSAFQFSLHLMFDQTLNNLIVCLMISQKTTTHKSSTNELACCSGYYLGLFFTK